jgi:MFS family permease
MTSSTSSAAPSTGTSPPRHALLRDRNVAWLMGGSIVSLLGDQFTLVALPWLVLRMTGDTLVLGTVLALLGIPRALFILIGGAVVDRHSPKQVLMLSKHANTVLLGTLALLVLFGHLTLPLVYALALGIGLSTAFSIPAATSMLPRVVAPQQLPAANGLMMGLRQLSFFVGPLLAGALIAWSGDGRAGSIGSAHDAQGLALAFGLDALSFVLSALTLSRVRAKALPARAHQASAGPLPSGLSTRSAGGGGTPPPGAPCPQASAGPLPSGLSTRPAGGGGMPPPGAPHPQAMFAAVAEGLRTFWRDRALRSCLLYWSAVALLVTGPVQIALPVLASSRPALGAAAFGGLLSAYGAGTLAGMLVSGARPHLRVVNLGMSILLVDALVGLLFMPMGRITTLWQGAALLASIGVLGGYMQVTVFTWIQRRVAPALLGRAMSVFMFIYMGLAPLSSAATGWLLRSISLPTLFMSAGAALVGLVLLALVGSSMRQVTDGPVVAAP